MAFVLEDLKFDFGHFFEYFGGGSLIGSTGKKKSIDQQ